MSESHVSEQPSHSDTSLNSDFMESTQLATANLDIDSIFYSHSKYSSGKEHLMNFDDETSSNVSAGQSQRHQKVKGLGVIEEDREESAVSLLESKRSYVSETPAKLT